MSIKKLLVILLISLATLVRLYNFSERMNFGPEQAISLIASGNNIKTKVTLLGQENVQRVTSDGHILFSGSQFTYSLIPLQLLFDHHPVPITGYFALLNVFTGIILFLVINKIFKWQVAFFSTFLFLFNDRMIYHSMFIWILNYLPLLGVIGIYLLLAKNGYRKTKNIFLLGLISGISFGLEYFFLFTALGILAYLVYESTNKIKTTITFLVGCILGDLPMVIFDLRHDFYHARSLWQYFVDTLQNPQQGSIVYYHFLHFWPVFALLGGIFLYYLWKNYRLGSILFMALYAIGNLSSGYISFRQPIGMSADLDIVKVLRAASDIKQDNPNNYNVASLLDFDTRGHILRYPLEFLFNSKPLDQELYKEAQSLYVISEKSYDFNNPTVWEINVFEPKTIELFSAIDEQYAVFKLTK